MIGMLIIRLKLERIILLYCVLKLWYALLDIFIMLYCNETLNFLDVVIAYIKFTHPSTLSVMSLLGKNLPVLNIDVVSANNFIV